MRLKMASSEMWRCCATAPAIHIRPEKWPRVHLEADGRVEVRVLSAAPSPSSRPSPPPRSPIPETRLCTSSRIPQVPTPNPSLLARNALLAHIRPEPALPCPPPSVPFLTRAIMAEPEVNRKRSRSPSESSDLQKTHKRPNTGPKPDDPDAASSSSQNVMSPNADSDSKTSPGAVVSAPPQKPEAAAAAAAAPSPMIHMRCLIVTQDASIIIGRAGAHVNEIREKSGARVVVSERIPGNPERILNVSGPLDAVSKVCGEVFFDCMHSHSCNFRHSASSFAGLTTSPSTSPPSQAAVQ